MVRSSVRAATDAAREFSARAGKSFAAGAMLAVSVVQPSFGQAPPPASPGSASTQVASSSTAASPIAAQIIETCNAIPVVGANGNVDLGADARCMARAVEELRAREQAQDRTIKCLEVIKSVQSRDPAKVAPHIPTLKARGTSAACEVAKLVVGS